MSEKQTPYQPLPVGDDFDFEEEDARFGCPKCRSPRVKLGHMMPVHLDVVAWDRNGQPAELGDETKFEDLMEATGTFWCRDCGHDFTEPAQLTEEE